MDIDQKIAELARLTWVYRPNNRRQIEPEIKKLLREILDQDLTQEQLIQVTGYGEVAARLGIYI